MAKVLIIVGTVTGNAEAIADHIKDELGDKHTIEVNDDVYDEITRDPEEILLFCTSNTGHGELPDNLDTLYFSLTHESPNIAGRQYALINLGDSGFPMYGNAGVILEQAIKDNGAVPLVDTLLIDSAMDRAPEETALAWAKTFL